MTKKELMALIVEGMRNYITEAPSVTPKINKENIMKKTELKSLVAEVVKQCVQEAGPQYKVRGKKSQLEQPGLRNKAREMQCDPEINEIAPPEGEDVETPDTVTPEDHPYDEQEEIEILKQMAQLLLKLLHMHKEMDSPDELESEPTKEKPPFPPKKASFPSKKSTGAEEEDDEELAESNHKVQHRSHKTIKDVPQNPENIRDPEIPMT